MRGGNSNGPPRFGMPAKNPQFPPGGRFRGPPPPFGPDQGHDPRGFNPRYMPPRPPNFPPRHNMCKLSKCQS